jgi:hypothetical protein
VATLALAGLVDAKASKYKGVERSAALAVRSLAVGRPP